MEIQIAIAKTNKFGSTESGDSLEFIERPNGGFSVVMADARESGRAAKAVSNMVVRKALSLLSEGIRDGAAARAASDYLFTEKGGTVSAFLNIISVDLQTSTIVISRNNPTPIFISRAGRVECLTGESNPIGNSRNIRPVISELPLEAGITIVMYTDGLYHAGEKYGLNLDVCMFLDALLEDEQPSAQNIADTILAEAVRLDQRQPNDDMSLVVFQVLPHVMDNIRRMTISFPVNPHNQPV
jgi:serine phosphatase RsbU (regulator of sigma subunit)